LIYNCLAISETRTSSKPKEIQTNKQYNSHTEPYTVHVRILYHHHLNVAYPAIIIMSIREMLPNLSLEMEFLGNVFTNFIFEKLLSYQALVMGRVTATSIT